MFRVGLVLKRLLVLFRRAELEREMDEELRAHVEMEREELTRGGLSAEEARRQALAAFGGVERTKEEAREARGFPWLEDLAQDVRYAARGLARTPGFALAVVLTIGVAVGANTAAFSWVDRLVLRPLPGVNDADRLVLLQPTDPQTGTRDEPGYDSYREWRETARAFDGVALRAHAQLSMRTTGPAQRVWGEVCSGNLFQVLGVRTQLGRALTADDEERSTAAAVISHGLWQRAFGRDPGVVGKHVLLNGHDFMIVGVAPPDFAGTIVGLGFDLWIPMAAARPLAIRNGMWTEAVARLKPAVTVQQARQDINAIYRGQVEAGRFARGTDVAVRGWTDRPESRALKPLTGTLLGIAALVLLVACLNVGNLLLARGNARQREIGVRLALGAGRARLARQLLTESLVLALAGGALGVVIGLWLRGGIGAFLPTTTLPVAVQVDVSWRLVCFSAAATVLSGLGFGLIPALGSSRVEPLPALRDGTLGVSRRGTRVQGVLVAGQVAFSLVALVCAGLFVHSLRSARAMDTGLRDPSRVLLVGTDLSLAGIADSSGPGVLERLVAEVGALPGVRSAGAGWIVPLGFVQHRLVPPTVEGRSGNAGGAFVPFNLVGPGYFETVGAGLLRGRGFTAADRREAAPVAVVNEEFARRYWPDEEPVGRRFNLGDSTRTAPDSPAIPVWWTVVGVARDGKYRSLTERATPLVYLPLAQRYVPDVTLHVRVDGDPRQLQQAVRSVFERIDPDLPVVDVRTLEGHIAVATFMPRLGAWVLSALGGVALLLAVVGLYGVLSYLVSQRTREIGVRVALGADRWSVMRLVVGRALRLTAIGLAAGLLLAAGAGLVLRSQLLGVSPLDPVTFGGVVALLVAVALLAAWVPARRAAAVDPMVALQAE